MKNTLYNLLIQRKKEGRKSFAVLIDPDKTTLTECNRLLDHAAEHSVDFFFIGGSLVTSNHQQALITCLKEKCPQIPVILFPGHALQLCDTADGILLLSLVSGRNPELLIGQHVQVAARLKASALEVLPTAYILVDPGHATSVSYMSNTLPVPSDKPAIASNTALAAELLGMRLVYLDAGSGAARAVPSAMIKEVSQTVEAPLIVGGGINTVDKAETALRSGADVIVIGNAIEKNPGLIGGVSDLLAIYNRLLDVH